MDSHPERGQPRRRPARWFVAAGCVGVAGLAAVVTLPDGGRPNVPADAVEVRMADMAFVPSTIRANPGQEIFVVNGDRLVHSLLVVGMGSGVEVAPGHARSFVVPGDATGTFRVICDIPGHVDAGMVAELTVNEVEITGGSVGR